MRVNERTAQLPRKTRKLTVEVTGRKKAEPAVRETDQKYRTLFHSNSTGIAITTLDGEVVDANQTYQDMVGYTLKELSGTNVRKLTPKKWHKLEAEATKHLMSEGYGIFEKEYIRKDGTIFPISLSAWLIRDGQGNPAGIGAFVKDITGRKKAEPAVRETDQKYRTLFHSNSTGIAITTLDGEVVDANQTYQDMVGYTLKELSGTNVRKLTPKKWHKLEAEAIKHLMSEGYGTFEKEYIRKDGTIFPVSLSAWLIRDRQGNPAGIGAFVKDTAQHQQPEKTLRQADSRYKALFDRTLYCIYVHDFEGRFLDANDAALNLLGYTREELTSINISSLLGEDQLPTALKTLEEIKQTGRQKRTTEYKLTTKDSDYVWVETEASLVYQQGEPYAIQGIAKDITERKRTEEALRESEGKYRRLVEQSLQGLVVIQDFRIVFANTTFAKISGYTVEELLFLPPEKVQAMIHPEDQALVWERFRDRLAGKPVSSRYEYRGIRKDGTVRWLEMFASRIEHRGRPAIQGVIIDITERKRTEEALEESEEKYRTQFEGALDAIFLADTETGMIVDCNQEACKLVGRKKSEIVGQHQRILHPRQKTKGVTRTFRQHLGEKQGQLLETQVITKKGELKDVAIKANVIEFRGKKWLQGIFRDVTERKQAEDILRKLEEEWRHSFNSLEDVMLIIDRDYNIENINDKGLALLNKSKEEVVGRKCYEVISGADGPAENCPCREALKTRKPASLDRYEKRFSKYFSIRTSPIFDENGEITKFVDLRHDITERKRAEEALQEAKTRFEALFETANELIITTDVEGWVLRLNKEVEKLSGYSKKELIGKSILEIAYPEDKDKYVQFWQDILNGLSPHYELRTISKTGVVSNLLASGNAIEKDGNIVEIQYNAKDITEEKQAEEKLRESEGKYRTILESVTEGYYEIDLAGNLTFFNDSLCRTLGYTKDALMGMNNKEYMDEENAAKVYQVFNEVYRAGKPCTRADWEIIRKDGTKLSVSSSVSLITDSQGKPIGFRGLSRDITEQKRAAEELRQSEQKYRAILESVVEGYYEVDLAGNFTFVNDSICQNIGYSRDELLGMNNRDYMDEQTAKKVLERYAEVYTTGQPARGFDFEVIKKDGTKLFISVSISLITDSKGEPTGFRGVVRDITDEKKAEEALRQSEEEYRNLFESATDAVFTTNMQGRFTSGNRKVEEICGYNREELIGKSFTSLILRKEVQRMQNIFQEITKGKPATFEVDIKDKSGNLVPLEVSATSIIRKGGETVGMLAMARDITERRQAQEKLQKSEERYRSLFETATDGIFTMDLHTRFTSGNRKAEEMCGYSRDEIIGKYATVILPEEEIPRMADAMKKVLGGKTDTYETRIITKNGELLPVEVTSSPIEIDGKIIGTMGMARDITERKKAEQTLRESEEKYRQLTEEINDAIYTVDQDGNVTYVSPVIEWLIGYSPSEMMGRSFAEFFHEEDLPRAMEDFERVLSGHSTEGEYRFHTKSGEIRWLGTSNRPIFAGDSMGGARGTLTDITERKLAEIASEEARTRFEDLFETANELIITTDPEGWILHVNKEVEKFSSYSKKELIGQSILKIAYPEDVPKYIQFWKDILDGLTPRYHLRGFSKTGNISHLLASASVVKKDGKIVEIQYNAKDITEEKQAEENLRESEKKYRTILENMTEGYYEADLKGNFVFFNDSLCQIAGCIRDELMGTNNRKYMDKENARKVYRIFNKVYTTGKPATGFEFEIIKKNGTKKFVEASASLIRDSEGKPTGFRGVVRDTTDRKQMEAEKEEMEQRAQLASRLSIVGEMASGIVHEVNNPLTSVIGFAEMLASKDIPEDAKDYARIINNEGKRVANIAGRLLNFARHQKPETVHTDINELLQSTLDLQTYEMTTGNIKVTTELDPHLPQTMADPGQLQQVFLNIMLNARTAMRAAHGGGKFSVKTQALDDTIQIFLKDNGPGIPKQNLKKIFDPFFTTRKAGEGTGLGLSICQGIINSHNGKIHAESTPGKGATFVIELPVVARQRKTATTAKPNASTVWR
jgi:PAS domain S-box-containing protein